jgi:glycosyltransferase involved in cell wall biosynthesis
MAKGISIVICTYNGSALLPATLEHIARQQVPAGIAWEVIVVNNASTDDSAQVADNVWATLACDVPFTITHQPIPGLNNAREKGFTTASYEYILMCDDDNWLASNYVSTAFDIMEENPAIGMLGGNGKLTYETTPPDWAIEYPIHASGPQAPNSGQATLYGVYGAGSVMRKSAYERIRQAGFKFLLTDRLGSQLSSGGDFELCHGLAMAGYWIWYDERLVFTHFITSNRFTWSYYVNYLNQDALSFTVLEPYGILLKTKSHNLFVFWGILLKNLIRFIFSFFYALLIDDKLGLNRDTKAGKLKLIILKPRIFSYIRFVKMTQNFRSASAFQRRFGQQMVRNKSVRERVFRPDATVMR